MTRQRDRQKIDFDRIRASAQDVGNAWGVNVPGWLYVPIFLFFLVMLVVCLVTLAGAILNITLGQLLVYALIFGAGVIYGRVKR